MQIVTGEFKKFGKHETIEPMVIHRNFRLYDYLDLIE